MPDILHVTLDTNTEPTSVDIDQTGNANVISRGANRQSITWQVVGNAATGSFVSMSDPEPGFEWVDAPPAGIFGDPTLSSNGKQLTLTDLHTGDETAGIWTYIVRIKVGGVVYKSRTTTLERLSTNPWIRND